MKKINLDELEIAYGDDDPEGYRVGHCSFGPLIGATAMGATVYELQEGQSICPYHYEYGCEEWAIVLRGRPTLRHPDGEDVLEPGDVVCFPEGPEGAHKLTNNARRDRARDAALRQAEPRCRGLSGQRQDRHLPARTTRTTSWFAARAGVDYFDGEL